MSLNIHIPATQHAVQSCCAGFAATARQTWCALSLLRHHQGRPGVLIFPEHAWSAFLLRRSPHKKTAQSCGPRLLLTAAPVCDPALFSLARLRTGVKTCAIFTGSASHRSENPRYFPCSASHWSEIPSYFPWLGFASE